MHLFVHFLLFALLCHFHNLCGLLELAIKAMQCFVICLCKHVRNVVSVCRNGLVELVKSRCNVPVPSTHIIVCNYQINVLCASGSGLNTVFELAVQCLVIFYAIRLRDNDLVWTIAALLSRTHLHNIDVPEAYI
jgi:hypothetical protein